MSGAEDAAVSTVDLHTHSTASDGVLAPAQLVALAVARGLRVLGLTDHDTVAGLAEASAAADAAGLHLIPGVELSTHVTAGEVHVLGYYVDLANPALTDALARFRDARANRARTMVERLAAAGVTVEYARVEELAGGAIGRPHVARTLVEAGHATSVNDAFARYLVRGKPGYVERYRLTPPEAVRLIRAAGGVAVLAHPHSIADLATTLPTLLEAGLDGLECYYGDYDDTQCQALLALAAQHNLVPTGGTDFHGPGLAHQRPLGGTTVPPEVVEHLTARWRERSRSG